MQGRRLLDSTWPDVLPAGDELRDGDYWFCQGTPESRRNAGFEGCWYVYFDGAGGIPRHHVIEHEDGTISIPCEPHPEEGHCNSVLIQRGDRELFHGYVNHGTWQQI